jgi:hypothetical protein
MIITDEVVEFAEKLDRLHTGMTEAELLELLGEPVVKWDDASALSMLPGYVMLRPAGKEHSPAAASVNWVYKSKFGDFQAAVRAGKVVDLIQVGRLIERLRTGQS